MAHNPALLAAWETLRNHVVHGNSLSDRQLEIVILRTGHRRDAAYEWAHHVLRGRKAGLTDLEIAACQGNAGASAEMALLIKAVDRW